ncbi:MAG TPA: TIM barrel protein [Anaerolineae bacterium]|nr:TIM barrel protein [Anaerolineae bacterium]
MKLGVNTYTYMWSIGFKGPNPAFPDNEARPERPLTALGLLEKARALGLHLVQTGPNLPVDKLPEAEFEAFIQQARAWNIELELGTRGLDYDHLVKQVAMAKRMGAKLIRTLPEIEGKYATDARLIPPVVRQIVPVLEREGVRLAIENGKTPAVNLRAALDEIHSPCVGLVLDMVNSLAIPEGWRYVTQLLAPHTMCVHYKDFTIKRAWHMMGFICEGMPAGKGLVETEWLLNELKASPYDFNVIIELWPPEQEKLQDTIDLEQAWAIESVPYLRKFIKD